MNNYLSISNNEDEKTNSFVNFKYRNGEYKPILRGYIHILASTFYMLVLINKVIKNDTTIMIIIQSNYSIGMLISYFVGVIYHRYTFLTLENEQCFEKLNDILTILFIFIFPNIPLCVSLSSHIGLSIILILLYYCIACYYTSWPVENEIIDEDLIDIFLNISISGILLVIFDYLVFQNMTLIQKIFIIYAQIFMQISIYVHNFLMNKYINQYISYHEIMYLFILCSNICYMIINYNL